MGDPVFVFDDDCGFCTWWAEFFAAHADLRIVGFTDVDAPLEARLPEGYERCSHLVTDGGVYSCGASIEEALVRTTSSRIARRFVDTMRNIPPYVFLREWGYRRVAHNRHLWGRVLSKRPPARD